MLEKHALTATVDGRNSASISWAQHHTASAFHVLSRPRPPICQCCCAAVGGLVAWKIFCHSTLTDRGWGEL